VESNNSNAADIPKYSLLRLKLSTAADLSRWAPGYNMLKLLEILREQNKIQIASPATDSEINDLEIKLSIKLPSQYIQLLKYSNGLQFNSELFDKILSANEVGLYKDLSAESHSIWTQEEFTVSDDEYSIYGEKQDPVYFRPQYLHNSVQISNEFDAAVILLNPNIIFPDNWEVIVVASWYPGAARYKSLIEFFETL
jgi:hypothetical protein